MVSWWPDCSNVGNKTALTPEQSKQPFFSVLKSHSNITRSMDNLPIRRPRWTIQPRPRPYSRQRGFSKHVRRRILQYSRLGFPKKYFIHGIFKVCRSVLFSTSQEAKRLNLGTVQAIETWFLDPDTKMNPNLNYSQVIRGPWNWNGSHEGVL